MTKDGPELDVDVVLMAVLKALSDGGDLAGELSVFAELEEQHGFGCIIAILRERVVQAVREVERESGWPRTKAVGLIPLENLEPDMGLWVTAVMLERDAGKPPVGGPLPASEVMAGIYVMCVTLLAADADHRPF